jgi:hypothetical protein
MESSEPRVIRECLEKNLNYRLLEQLPVRISSIDGFRMKRLIKVPCRIQVLHIQGHVFSGRNHAAPAGGKLAPGMAFGELSSHS